MPNPRETCSVAGRERERKTLLSSYMRGDGFLVQKSKRRLRTFRPLRQHDLVGEVCAGQRCLPLLEVGARERGWQVRVLATFPDYVI